MCQKQLTLMDLLSSCLSAPMQERRDRETKAEINSFVTELCSFTRQDKAAVQVGCRWDQLSTVCLILWSPMKGKNNLNCAMIYWQGQSCLTEPYSFPHGCNHSQGDLRGWFSHAYRQVWTCSLHFDVMQLHKECLEGFSLPLLPWKDMATSQISLQLHSTTVSLQHGCSCATLSLSTSVGTCINSTGKQIMTTIWVIIISKDVKQHSISYRKIHFNSIQLDFHWFGERRRDTFSKSF